MENCVRVNPWQSFRILEGRGIILKKSMFLIIFLSIARVCFCQETDKEWFLQNYTKQEEYIPMRDGVKLYTVIYTPKDKSERHPILMERSPYSCRPYGPDEYMSVWGSYKMQYAKANFIFVKQDVRGKFMSEGEFVEVRPFIKNKVGKQVDEASDTYDTIEWLVKNIKNNNNRVGVMGVSYPGFYAGQAALSAHPSLVAASPQAPVTDWFMGDDWHHNGVFFMMDAQSFYRAHGTPRPIPSTTETHGFTFASDDNYDAFLKAGSLRNLAQMMGDSSRFWQEMYRHPNYDDWWQSRNARNGFYNIKPAILWVGGLFDAEDCFGAWASYKAAEEQSPETNSKIVMGPWYHGQWSHEGSFLGNVRFGSNTSAYYQDSIEVPFFIYHLLGNGSVENIAEASVFFTGENNWKQFNEWPPKSMENQYLYLRSNGELLLNSQAIKATDQPTESGKSFDAYISDPAHPVPYTEDVHIKRTREYMTDDQRFASRRPDVVTYESLVLDNDMTLAGPVVADLWFSLSTTDADFVVKVIDVFPDDFKYDEKMKGKEAEYPMGGYEMLVRSEIMRGKFRNSFEDPEPFVPGEITSVKWTLPDVAHTFKKGHKIMIQIQSSWFPLADRNPQKFVNIYDAREDDFQKAEIRIYRDATHASRIVLPVLE